MFFKSSLALAVAIIALAFVQAQQPAPTCYTPSGATSGAGNCSQFINSVCDSMALGPLSTDAITAGGRAARCFNLVDGLGRRCDLTIASLLSTGAAAIPDNTNCKTGFANVASHCDFGGRSSVTGDTNFFYNLDIHFGECQTLNLAH